MLWNKKQEGKTEIRPQGEQKFAAAAPDVIIDAMGDAMTVFDMERKIIKVNKPATKLWGYTEEEMLKWK